MDYYTVALILSKEHPQTIAVALNRLGDKDSAEVMKLMPSHMQVDLFDRMSRTGEIEPEIMAEIDAMLAPLIK